MNWEMVTKGGGEGRGGGGGTECWARAGKWGYKYTVQEYMENKKGSSCCSDSRIFQPVL